MARKYRPYEENMLDDVEISVPPSRRLIMYLNIARVSRESGYHHMRRVAVQQAWNARRELRLDVQRKIARNERRKRGEP